MKINFDELFSMTKSPSTDNFKKNSYQSQASTTPGMYQNFLKKSIKSISVTIIRRRKLAILTH